jgi:hypothetical protein
MISYVGLFILCPLFSTCYSAPAKPFPSMKACVIAASKTQLGVCRKFEGGDFVGYISKSKNFGDTTYGDVR